VRNPIAFFKSDLTICKSMFADGSVSEFDFLAIRWMHEWAEAHRLLKTRLLTPTKKNVFLSSMNLHLQNYTRYAMENIY